MKMLTILLLVVFTIISIIAVWLFMTRVNTNFATEALLEFHYESVPGGYNPDASISVVITDESDLAALREILRGRSFRDSFHCSFSTDISITMTDGNRSIMFCPAHDGCPVLRIGDSNRYIRISLEQRSILNEIFRRYGGFFPAI